MARWCGRSFLVPLVAMMAAAFAGRGAENIVPGSPSSDVVLQNLFLNQTGGAAWSQETMEIEASLPRLKKTGRMRVVRRLNPAGEADYDVLEMAGDSTVKRQVIARYLSADQRAAVLPASSVAMTPRITSSITPEPCLSATGWCMRSASFPARNGKVS